MKRLLPVVFALLSTAPAHAWTIPTDAEIRAILADRVDERKQSVGIVVGVVTPQGRRVVSYGRLGKGDPRRLDGNTVFEIGSVTKVFNSLLLADMTVRDQVALNDPVAKYLPSSVQMPQRGGKQITLADLSTHTSGLPRLPNNMPAKDPRNPYADYSMAQLYQFLGSYRLTRDIGSQYEYSNLGAGLLGDALARKARLSYEELIRQRISRPLGMNDTAVTLFPSMQARFAIGHDAELKPFPYWNLPTLAGSGALRSTANDLLTLLEAEMGLHKTVLRAAMEKQLSVRRPTTAANTDIALGWQVLNNPRGPIFFHSGGTGGFRTFVAFNRERQEAVVALANTSTPLGVDDIGYHILIGEKLAEPRAPQDEVTLDKFAKEKLLGHYRLSPTRVLEITLEGEQLFAQLTRLPKDPIFPASATKLFWRGEDGEIDFQLGEDGKATVATVRFNGRENIAPRDESPGP